MSDNTVKNTYYESLTWEAHNKAKANKITRENHNALGKNEFMKLLITQLQHQDPLKPQDNTAYIAQLAQFSSLEGIQNLNQSVGNFGTTLRSTQALQASALVGRRVSVETSKARLNVANVNGQPQVAGISGEFALDKPLRNVSLRIRNSGNALVNEISLGNLPSGKHNLYWDGKDTKGNFAKAGEIYKIEVVGDSTEASAKVFATTILDVNIDSVSLGKSEEGNKIIANIAGVGSVPIEQIKEFR